MSSGKSEKVLQEFLESSYKNISKSETDISQIVIPFSKMFKTYKPADIYSGVEKIPFKERDSEYKSILKQEFANFI